MDEYNPMMSLKWPEARAVKFRTRYLLPLEMLLAFMVFTLGISGGFGHGPLSVVLRARGEVYTWAILLGLIGTVWLCAAVIEWIFGLRWNASELRVAIWIRMWSAFLGVVAWVICGYVLVDAGHAGRILTYMMLAPAATLFCGWCWWVNYRTEVMMDPSLDTRALERRMEQRNASW